MLHKYIFSIDVLYKLYRPMRILHLKSCSLNFLTGCIIFGWTQPGGCPTYKMSLFLRNLTFDSRILQDQKLNKDILSDCLLLPGNQSPSLSNRRASSTVTFWKNQFFIIIFNRFFVDVIPIDHPCRPINSTVSMALLTTNRHNIYIPPQAKWNNVKERVFFLKTTK